jgi:hypothetical protein
VLAACFFVSAPALAGDPTTADCLRASEREVQLKNEHKLRDARAQALTCAASSCPADVRAECERRIQLLNAAMPTVVFDVQDQSGAAVTDVKVSMDGALLVERLEGTAISLDPGEHTFLFEVPGKGSVERKLLLLEGDKNRRERVVLESAAAPPAPEPPAPAPAPAAWPTPEGGSTPGRTQRILGLVVAGAGVVGMGIATGIGLAAKSHYDDSKGHCTGNLCDAQGGAIRDDARSTGNVGTVVFVVGAVALAGGVVLWLTAPSSDKPSSAGAAPAIWRW